MVNASGRHRHSPSIALRNENRPPKASFTAVQIGARHVLLNASESVDPDGLALTYKWWDGSSLLSTKAEQYQTTSLEAGSKHTFKLEVADPGGLKSTSEQTVTIATLPTLASHWLLPRLADLRSVGNAKAARRPAITQKRSSGMTAWRPSCESAGCSRWPAVRKTTAQAIVSARPLPQYIAR